MINNFEQVEQLLKFESDDDFYFLAILKRKKEHRELGSNSYLVKSYYITSLEHLNFYKEEMIHLAEFHNARVYINLNRRSFEKLAFQQLKKITDQILNKDYKSIRKAYNSVCGKFNAGKDKFWMLDVDDVDFNKVLEIAECVKQIEPINESKIKTFIQTKNGWHIITTPFNTSVFYHTYPDIVIGKDDQTILYIP